MYNKIILHCQLFVLEYKKLWLRHTQVLKMWDGIPLHHQLGFSMYNDNG